MFLKQKVFINDDSQATEGTLPEDQVLLKMVRRGLWITGAELTTIGGIILSGPEVSM